MPFDEKIPLKHITLQCHFVLLTFSGTRGKQLALSSPNNRAQTRVNFLKLILPEEGIVQKCVCVGVKPAHLLRQMLTVQTPKKFYQNIIFIHVSKFIFYVSYIRDFILLMQQNKQFFQIYQVLQNICYLQSH